MNFTKRQHIISGNPGTRFGLVILLLLFSTTLAQAQNIMFINNTEATISDTVNVSIAINNEDDFISFQSDLLIPVGFHYIEGSIKLSERSTDHVLNATQLEDNSLRILSYSLNNSIFLDDTGIVAEFKLSTPPTPGEFAIGLTNAIIGNSSSQNIITSQQGATITLKPLGISEVCIENTIECFPNPFTSELNIRIKTEESENISLKVFNVSGVQCSSQNLTSSQKGLNFFVFDATTLLGNNTQSGLYILEFTFSNRDNYYSTVRKVFLKD